MFPAGHNLAAAGVNNCKEKRKFRITVRVKKSRTMTKVERRAARSKALRDRALRAMAAACEYHRGCGAIGASDDESEMSADESNGSSSSRFD